MNRIVERLRQACGSGEILTIGYGGGSNPGSPREVIPLSCSASVLEARDVVAGVSKQYRLDKILWVEAGGVREEATPTPGGFGLPTLQSLDEYATHLRPEFESLGWYVHQDETSFGVGGFFNNGKPKKTPSVAISFLQRTTDSVYDPELEDIVEVERVISGNERPWRVDSWRYKAGRTFGSLQKAMWEFYNEVRVSDPRSAKGMFAGH